MATLVLIAVGSAIGGPIGGAIGAALGQQIDTALFAPAPRQGSRLKELAVQTSSYGTQIPAIYGAMRVAGTVIWSTDLVEQRSKSGGGKGRPSVVNYSYRVSLAVALSSAPIIRIGRIWADGNLIRGASGDFKIDAQMRLYNGHNSQRPDPLIASAEAVGQCPAHRGLAYVVFEDLQLADFGNRIPSLTFEIFERDGPLDVSSFLENVSGGEITAQSGIKMVGMAAVGASVREAVAVVLDICPLELVVRDGILVARDIAVSPVAPSNIVVASEANGRALALPKRTLPPTSNIPGSFSLRYYDANRDYQAGVQQTSVEPPGRGKVQLELPAVLTSLSAKFIVEAKHSAVLFERDRWIGTITNCAIDYAPGDVIRTPDNRNWQIVETEVDFGVTTINARAISKNVAPNSILAVPGRVVSASDVPVGETQLVLIDLPLISGGDANRAALSLFSAGTQAGWRRASITITSGNQQTDLGSTARSAIMGYTRNTLSPHPSYLVDEASVLNVELLNSSMTLDLRNTSPLAVDAPTFWVDGEFVRAGGVAALGGQQYRLSRLSRGCFASNLKAPAHSSNARIVLLESASALALSDINIGIGQIIEVEASGLGDAVPVTESAIVEGLAIKPLAPVHGRARRNADGSLDVAWIRRSRLDLGWIDGVDQAQAEDQESYRVVLMANGVGLREWVISSSSLRISAAEVAAIAVPPNAVIMFDIRQIGRFA